MLVKEHRPLRTLQGNSKQLALIVYRAIEHGFHAFHSTLQFRDVKAADLRREQLVRDVERGHDRDALEPDHLAVVADLAHLLVEVVDGVEQPLLLALRARDAKFAPHDVDLEALWFRAHASSSGI